MRLHPTLYLSALTALFPFTLANFDIYVDHYRQWSSTAKDEPGFRIFGDTPTDPCKYVNNVRFPPCLYPSLSQLAELPTRKTTPAGPSSTTSRATNSASAA
jgi:hypothetical protein